MSEETKEVRLNEKTMTQEEFQRYQESIQGQKDISIVQTGKDEYRTKIQD